MAAADISVEWDPNPTAESYILVAETNGVSWSVPLTTTKYTYTNVVVGTTYTLQVFGVNMFGQGPGSDTLTITPSNVVVIIPKPDPPVNLSFVNILLGQGSTMSLSLRWETPTNIVKHRVIVNGVSALETTNRTAQLNKLATGITNSITITAINSVGDESQESRALSVYIEKELQTLNLINFKGTVQQ